MGNFILCPEGWAVDLDDVSSISPVAIQTTYYYFKCYMKGVAREENFKYVFDRYNESPEELLVKVQNIRQQLILRCNDNVEVKEINGSINLKK